MWTLWLIVWLAVLAAGIWFVKSQIFFKNAWKIIGKIMIMLCITVALFIAWFVVTLITTIGNVHANVHGSILTVFFVLLTIACGCALWGVIKKKYVYIPICISIVLCIVVLISYNGYQSYIDSIPTVGETDSVIGEYAPFAQDGKVATLDEESDLRLTEDLPKLDGATALYPIYSAFVRAVYPEPTDDSAVETLTNNEFITCSTTTGAYRRIVDGSADIIFVGGPSKEQEKYAEEKGIKLIYTPIGKEAFVFFVNSTNPIENITVEQIQDIYSGKVTNWSDLGIDDLGDIRAFQRDEGSGSQSALVRLMDGKELMTPPEENVIEGMGGIISKTADYKNYKNALGYSFRFYSTQMVKNNEIKLLNIEGIEPTVDNIENGTYPVASYFYAVTRSDRDANTEKLINWILGEQGQTLIERTGYTPINRFER